MVVPTKLVTMVTMVMMAMTAKPIAPPTRKAARTGPATAAVATPAPTARAAPGPNLSDSSGDNRRSRQLEMGKEPPLILLPSEKNCSLRER